MNGHLIYILISSVRSSDINYLLIIRSCDSARFCLNRLIDLQETLDCTLAVMQASISTVHRQAKRGHGGKASAHTRTRGRNSDRFCT